jgi:hypothetical protein
MDRAQKGVSKPAHWAFSWRITSKIMALTDASGNLIDFRLLPPLGRLLRNRLPGNGTGSRSPRHGGFDRRANLWPVPCRPGIRCKLAA